MNRKFVGALSNKTYTENGMPTPVSSTNPLVDLFYRMGATRQDDERKVINYFSPAYYTDKINTVKAMFYNRDIRGGQGERRSFRIFLRWLISNDCDTALKILPLIPEYGRWDDTFEYFFTPLENNVINLIMKALLSGDKLCAKWMPREGKKNAKIAKRFMDKAELTPRNYRKLLAGNTQVVESLMCKKQWGEINYSHVPSVASNNYRKAFYKHDEQRYAQWVEDVQAGKKTVHASAIFPNDIVHKVFELYNRSMVERNSVDAQWKALPNYVPEGKSFIPVCDVSGSMSGQPMEVCISLGIYLSERNKGPFENAFITFSGNPELQEIKGKDLYEKVHSLNSADWGYNTNLEAVFNLILNTAVRAKLSQADLPQNVIILSDMQFDQCVGEPSHTAFAMIKTKYQNAGYEVPGVIFWNLRNSVGVPVSYSQTGAALVSGFSPSVMKNVLSGELSPIEVVLRTLNSERYQAVEEALLS